MELVRKANAEYTTHPHSGVADVAEAAARLEQFSADLSTRKSDLINAERALRKVLGLPLTDNRRIVATTKPIDVRISFDWDACVEEMSQEQPDNLEQQAIVRLAELSLLLARDHLVLLPLDAATRRQLTDLGGSFDSAEAVWLGRNLRMFARRFRPH